MKRIKLQVHTTTWMNLRCIVLSRRETLKSTYTLILFTWHSAQANTYKGWKTDQWLSDSWGSGEEMLGFEEVWGHFWWWQNVLHLDCGHGYICQNLQNFTLSRVDFILWKLYLNYFNQKRVPREFLLQLHRGRQAGVKEVKGRGKAFQAEETAGRSMAVPRSAGRRLQAGTCSAHRGSRPSWGDEAGIVGRACRASGLRRVFVSILRAVEPLQIFCVGKAMWIQYGEWVCHVCG